MYAILGYAIDEGNGARFFVGMFKFKELHHAAREKTTGFYLMLTGALLSCVIFNHSPAVCATK